MSKWPQEFIYKRFGLTPPTPEPDRSYERELEGQREQRRNRRLVALWNARAARKLPPSFYPTIGAAISAETPWLQVLCPGCQTIGEVDLRKVDRHHGAAISSLIPALSCRRCCPNPPFAKLLELRMTPVVASHWTEADYWAARRAGLDSKKRR